MADKVQKDKLIGEILIENKVITSEQLKQALAFQANEGGFICEIIIKHKFASSARVFGVLAGQIGFEFINFETVVVDGKALEKVPAKLAVHYDIFPYKLSGNILYVAMSDPLDIRKLDNLKALLNLEIKPALAWEEDVLENIQKYYGLGAEILEEMMARPGMKESMSPHAKVVEDLEVAVEEASILKFVNQLLAQACDEQATDIHFEPFEDESRVRFRIDGFLYEVPIPESIRVFHEFVVSRIKVMAGLDIAERRMPQDGRIKIKVRGQELDLRVSILPSSYGESVQIRILGAQSLLTLDRLGLADQDAQKLSHILEKSYGVLFVTGPTGSGKSTTLYASLNRKNLPNNKIITVEDPIEYQIRGVIQLQVNAKVGFTFAEGLRSILRHDPDIIMVGEVRDAETAEITIRSAMTGHLVFSTLHTNDAASAPSRLIDMGIEPFLVASSLEAIIAQRLVRVICPQCKQKKRLDPDIFRQENISVNEPLEGYEGKGCEACRFTGYKGRTAIFEILIVTDQIRDLIFNRVTSQVIKEKAFSQGASTLRQDGLKKVLQGITTVSEVMRVT